MDANELDTAVEVCIDGGIATILLDRPQKRNALRRSDWECFARALLELSETDDVRVVILRGAGGHFCSGADLRELGDRDAYQSYVNALRIQRVAELICALRKPTIACIEGGAIGAGLEIALACTFRLAGRSTTLALPEVKLHTLPGAGGTQRILQMAPRSIALRMLLLGESVGAGDALAAHLVDVVVDDDSVLSAANDLAARLLCIDAPTASLILDCVRVATEIPLKAGLAAEAGIFGVSVAGDTHKAAVRNFFETKGRAAPGSPNG